MAEREMIADITRQALLIGTSCITDPTGHIGYKTEVVQASALIRIADALEKQTDMLRGAHAGFTVEQQRDGLNHLHMVATNDSRLVSIQVLGTTPAMALKLSQAFGDVLKEMVDIANEELQEGGPDNG